jgi:hypothetical protein
VLAKFALPRDIAVDASNNIFIADSYNSAIRKISDGNITTVAGIPLTNGYSGDNGPATSAAMNIVRGIALDGKGGFYIGDTANHRVRYVNASGFIITFSGNGTSGYTGDGGPPTSAELNYPRGIAFDASGRLFIADGDSQRVRMITVVPTPSPSPSSSASKTASKSASHTHTKSALPTATVTKSIGASSSHTMTPSLSADRTSSSTETALPTDTRTGTSTPASTMTPSFTAAMTTDATAMESPSITHTSGGESTSPTVAMLVAVVVCGVALWL